MRTPVLIGVATGRAVQVLSALDNVTYTQRQGQQPRLVYNGAEAIVWRVTGPLVEGGQPLSVTLPAASVTGTWDIYLLMPVDLGDLSGPQLFDRLKTLAARPEADGYLTRPWTLPALMRQHPSVAAALFPTGVIPNVIAGDDPALLAVVDYDP